jgi:hypothetical protein
MKKAKWIILTAILLVALTTSLAACGGDDAADDTGAAEPAEVVQEPSDTPAPPPTDTPVPPTNTPPPPPTDTPLPPPTEAAEEPAEEPEGDEGDLDLAMLGQAEDLDSFRSTMVLSWFGTTADGTEVSESMRIDVEFVREPPAQHVTISGDFPGMEDMGLGGEEALEMYVVDNTMHMNLFGSWVQMPAEEGGLDAEDMAFVATEEMLDGLEDTNYEGTTDYNGIEVEHYSFDESSFSAENMPEEMNIEEATGNIFIAKEGGYLVHMDMVMSGANLDLPAGEGEEMLQNGSMELTVDLTDINQPIDIVLPEEALASGEPPDDIPVPDNAEELQIVDFMGMITYLSPLAPEEVADYYIAEMPNNGWTQVSLDQMQGMHSLEYSKGDRTASILITMDTDTGKTTVLITTEGGG